MLKLTKKVAQHVSDAVADITENGPYDAGYGVCYSVHTYLLNNAGTDCNGVYSPGYSITRALCIDWPKARRNEAGIAPYWVPSPTEPTGPIAWNYTWDKWEGEQLALRIEMMQFMLTQIELTDDHEEMVRDIHSKSGW